MLAYLARNVTVVKGTEKCGVVRKGNMVEKKSHFIHM